MVYDMYTGHRQLDGTSELYLTSELSSTLLCARTPRAVGRNEPYLSLAPVVVHIDSHGEKCVVYDMYTGYRQLDGTSELCSTLLCVHAVLISCHIYNQAHHTM